MDETFLLPPCPIALPHAYWLRDKPNTFGTHVMLIQPSITEFKRVTAAIDTARLSEFDMEILNNLYSNTARVLPHRTYALLTDVFRDDEENRRAYLGTRTEKWDPQKVLQEAKYVHFSDWPMAKPWVADLEVMEELKPRCLDGDCRAQKIWLGLYSDFRERRQVSRPSHVLRDVAKLFRPYVEPLCPTAKLNHTRPHLSKARTILMIPSPPRGE